MTATTYPSASEPNVQELAAAIRARAGAGRRIAFVSGNFNVVHPGHLRLLKYASENADVLIVGLNPDSTAGVTITAEMRLEGVSSVSMVTEAVLLDIPPELFIAALRPDLVVKGREYSTRANREQEVVDAYGGKLLFSSGEVRFSSLSLLQREYLETNFSTIRKPLDYPRRHGFEVADLKTILPDFSRIHVLVIGDLIVDTYINCDPLGMSQEDPTIVVTPIDSRTFVGGAGIVAAHARGLGANVSFVTLTGNDQAGRIAKEQLGRYGIRTYAITDPSRPTTRKERFRALGKTLLRVNHLRQHSAEPALVERMLSRVRRLLPKIDLILFSDFNYGCLPTALVESISYLARKRGIRMAADSQASSQMADIARFKGMILVTPTEREARLGLQDTESGLVIVAERLKEKAAADNVVVTLGPEGLLVRGMLRGIEVTDRLPAFNTAPKDVAGAGDSFFACASLALCAGVDIWRAAYLGSLAAACQISRIGNVPLTVDDLVSEIDHASI